MSNVGANEDTKTLWIFGAGASRHLGFPLSYDLLARSVGLCTAELKSYEADTDLAYSYLKHDLAGRGKSAPTFEEIRRFKTDPVLALDYHYAWQWLMPDHNTTARLHSLFQGWTALPDLLSKIGLGRKSKDLLSAYPEQIIDEVRNVSPSSLVREHGFYDDAAAKRAIRATLETLTDIYFFTLSHFNEAARSVPRRDNFYRELVKSFILEKNARVITFNYDTMLDEAIFDDFTRSWHYGGMTVSGINGYPVARGQKVDLILIKPHGSLHFLICNSCKRAHVNWGWSFRRTGVNAAASENRRCVACRKPQPGRVELLSSLTVAPLYDKKIIKRSHQAILRAFAWAENVVAVGYSFPEQDTYFFNCIAQGLRLRKGKPLVVRVVSHTHESAKAIKKRLDSEAARRGIAKGVMKVRAEKLKGFEDIVTGTENVPISVN